LEGREPRFKEKKRIEIKLKSKLRTFKLRKRIKEEVWGGNKEVENIESNSTIQSKVTSSRGYLGVGRIVKGTRSNRRNLFPILIYIKVIEVNSRGTFASRNSKTFQRELNNSKAPSLVMLVSSHSCPCGTLGDAIPIAKMYGH
jgi:hypothetical protein